MTHLSWSSGDYRLEMCAIFQCILILWWPNTLKCRITQRSCLLQNYIRASHGIVPPDSSSGAALNGAAGITTSALKMTSKPPSSMVVGAGRPQPASLAAMPPPFTSAKREYSLDDDIGVALDTVLDDMGLIDNFLKTFLGAQEFKEQRCVHCSLLFIKSSVSGAAILSTLLCLLFQASVN